MVNNASGNVSIRKYTPISPDGDMITAKLIGDGFVSGDASLILEEGAILEVSKSSVLNLSSNLTFNIGKDDAALLIIRKGSSLNIADTGTITIDLSEDLIAGDYSFDIMEFEDDSFIFSLDQLEKDKNLFLTQNGESFKRDWSYGITTDNTFFIAVSVPEPAAVAAIFGTIAFIFAAYRRRK